jgi:PadR family transcriptional regulator, regulatory protein PadR
MSEMREPTFWILTALAGERHHGYALIAETSRLSDGGVALKVPTLYAALDRLVDEDLVAVDGEEVVDGRRRRYFRLTERGATALEEHTSKLESRARQARVRLSLRSGEARA